MWRNSVTLTMVIVVAAVIATSAGAKASGEESSSGGRAKRAAFSSWAGKRSQDGGLSGQEDLLLPSHPMVRLRGHRQPQVPLLFLRGLDDLDYFPHLDDDLVMGGRGAEDADGQVDKRAPFNSWAGKRAPFNSWAGKRAPFNSWAGKRGLEFVGASNNNLDSDEVFLSNHWAGGKGSGRFKRSSGEAMDDDDDDEVIAAKANRPRRQAAFSVWGGKRLASKEGTTGKVNHAFSAWGGK